MADLVVTRVRRAVPVINPIRQPLDQLLGEVAARPSAEKLRSPLIAHVRALGSALSICEAIRKNAASQIANADARNEALLTQLAEEQQLKQAHSSAFDRQRSKDSAINRLKAQEAERVTQNVAASFANAATGAAEEVVATGVAFDEALDRVSFELERPDLPSSDSELMRLTIEAKRWAARSLSEFQEYVVRAQRLGEDPSRTLFLIDEVVAIWTSKTEAAHARESARPSSVRGDSAALRQVQAIAQVMRSERGLEGLSWYVDIAKPRADALRRVITGVDPRQLDDRGFRRQYLTSGAPRGPFVLLDSWSQRYAGPAGDNAIAQAAKSFAVENLPLATTPTAKAKQPKPPATPGDERAKRAALQAERIKAAAEARAASASR